MTEKNEQLCHFNNKKEELEYYKSKYESFFKVLIKYQLKVKSLEKSNNKLREKVSNFLNKDSTNNNNNIENNFLTPSEFKNLWEYIIKTELIETFDFCINEYKLIANLCQDIMLLVYEECKKSINKKFIEVLNCLNLGKISKDKREKMYNNFLPFFRENFNKIFTFSENFLSIINTKLLSIILDYNYTNDIINANIINNDNSINDNSIKDNNTDNNYYLNKLKEIIKGNNFDIVIKSFYKICIYMLLHEPILNFDLQKYSQRKLHYYYFNKNDFINVDGFITDNSPCIILLSAPLLKNKFNFHNLRSPVYIIHNPNKYILDECEKNKNKDNLLDKKNDDIIYSDRIIKLNNRQDECPKNYKRNKTFEEKQSKIYANKGKSLKKKEIFNNEKSNQIKRKTNEEYDNINISQDINLNLQKYIKIERNKEQLTKNKSMKINNDILFNSLDNKLLYVVSQQSSMENNNNYNPSDVVQNYINAYEKRKNSNLISSSTGNFDVGKKQKNEFDKDNSNCNINNKINDLQIEQNINDIIMENLNKIKGTKLKEYYINNKKKKKKGIRNKNSKYYIKNNIYTNIKNLPNTTNNRILSKKNNYIHSNSQYFDLFSDKKISPSPSNLFKSYESFNDSSETNHISSPKNERCKNHNSFTHLLHFSNANSNLPVNAPKTSQNMIYNNLVLKVIKNNFNINNIRKNIQNSTNNINYNLNNKINFNNISINSNSIHNSFLTKNSFNHSSNRQKYISHIKNNENKSEIRERSSSNNYLKAQKNNNSSISNKQSFNSNNNIRYSIIKNNTNNTKKGKKVHKQIIKNSKIISEGKNNINQIYFNNCNRINKNDRNKNVNLYNKKNSYKNINKNHLIFNNNFNKTNKTNNYTINKNNSNNNINITVKGKNNNFNQENKLFKFYQSNKYIQNSKNKSTSPTEKNYSKKLSKNNLNEDKEKNNCLFHRNSNANLYNKYFTSESLNNLSAEKNNQKSFHAIKKVKKKVSNNSHIIDANNYNSIKKSKHKNKVIKYIKSIKMMNKLGNNSKIVNPGSRMWEGYKMNDNIFGLKQIYKNPKYSLQKPINSLPMEIYAKTEENNKETAFNEKYILKKYNNKNERKNETIEDAKKKSTSTKKEQTIKNKYI